MKPTRFPALPLFVGLLFSPVLTTILSASTVTHSRFVGTYLSAPSAGSALGPSMNASLGADGTVTLTEDPGNGPVTRFGHWIDTGTQVKITFDATEDQPADPPMVFEPSHDGLQAVTWNHGLWGKTNPPRMKHATKVKERFTHSRDGE